MRVAVIGSGYVGLTQGAGLAAMGHHVVCIDKDENRISTLKRGLVPFYEPGLQELMVAGVEAGRLTFEADVARALRGNHQFIFIAVGTPSDEDGRADLSALKSACLAIRTYADGAPIVVTKSTIPPGTTRDVVAPMVAPFVAAFNPEFLAEGSATVDFRYPARIVLGVGQGSARSLQELYALSMLAKLYEEHTRSGTVVYSMDATSAELVKYTSNSMLAARVAMVNEVAAIADEMDADIGAIMPAVGADPRIGDSFLRPGPGFGGSCFGKDVSALAALAEEVGVQGYMLDATLTSNEESRLRVVESIERMANAATARGSAEAWSSKGLFGLTIGVWGLAFKANTDDVRDSPALDIVRLLWNRGANLRLHDPKAMDTAKAALLENKSISPGTIEWCDSPLEAARGAHLLVVLTEWNEYRVTEGELLGVRGVMRPKSSPHEVAFALFDGRNIIDPRHAKSAGFSYQGIGRR